MEVRVPTERVLLDSAASIGVLTDDNTEMAMVAKVAMTRAAVATAETPKAATSNEYSCAHFEKFWTPETVVRPLPFDTTRVFVVEPD